MSPELINNEKYDERCDVWSVGCLLVSGSGLQRIRILYESDAGVLPYCPSPLLY